MQPEDLRDTEHIPHVGNGHLGGAAGHTLFGSRPVLVVSVRAALTSMEAEVAGEHPGDCCLSEAKPHFEGREHP